MRFRAWSSASSKGVSGASKALYWARMDGEKRRSMRISCAQLSAWLIRRKLRSGSVDVGNQALGESGKTW